MRARGAIAVVGAGEMLDDQSRRVLGASEGGRGEGEGDGAEEDFAAHGRAVGVICFYRACCWRMSHYECDVQEEAEQAVMSVGDEREVEGMSSGSQVRCQD